MWNMRDCLLEVIMEEVMTKELTISKKKLEKLSPDELNDLAETKANFIMQHLLESTEKIQ